MNSCNNFWLYFLDNGMLTGVPTESQDFRLEVGVWSEISSVSEVSERQVSGELLTTIKSSESATVLESLVLAVSAKTLN